MASRDGAPSSSSSGASSVTARSTADPILRNALRYTISAREYATLHKYVISRSRALKKRAPTVDTVQRIMEGTRGRTQATGKGGRGKGRGADGEEEKKAIVVRGADDYNARAIRHSIRVFVATGALMKLWGVVSARLMRKKECVKSRLPTLDSSRQANSSVVALHRQPTRSNPSTSRRLSDSPCLSVPSYYCTGSSSASLRACAPICSIHPPRPSDCATPRRPAR